MPAIIKLHILQLWQSLNVSEWSTFEFSLCVVPPFGVCLRCDKATTNEAHQFVIFVSNLFINSLLCVWFVCYHRKKKVWKQQNRTLINQKSETKIKICNSKHALAAWSREVETPHIRRQRQRSLSVGKWAKTKWEKRQL